MSSESDNEEFYDACDITPSGNQISGELSSTGKNSSTKHEKAKDKGLMPPPRDLPLKLEYSVEGSRRKSEKEDSSSTCSGSLLGTLGENEEEEESVTPRLKLINRRARHRERRNRTNDEEDDTFPPSPGESQSSSVDAIFLTNQTSAPFRVVEVDATSVYSTTFSQDKGSKAPGLTLPKIEAKEEISLRVEKREEIVIADVESPKESECVMALSPEPDIVASTKSNSLPRIENQNESERILLSAINNQLSLSTQAEASSSMKDSDVSSSSKIVVISPPVLPVAPPRRNKKKKNINPEDTVSVSSVASLPVPGISFTSPFKDSDTVSHCLNIEAAIKGDFIVNPQDTQSCKAQGDSDLNCAESLGDTTSQSSTPENARTRFKNFQKLELVSPEMLKQSSENLSNTPSTESIASSILSGEVEPQNTPPPPIVKVQNETGKELTEVEILEQVPFKNLDTGEITCLSDAGHGLPSSLNPLYSHIMKKANAGAETENDDDSDDGSIVESRIIKKIPEFDTISVKKKTNQIKKFIGKKMESAVNKAKNLAQEVSHRKQEDKDVFEDDAPAQNIMQAVKIKTSHGHKGPAEFNNLMYVQELKGVHTGPVWCMKFSPCGRLLATAGQDHVLRVWVLKQAFTYFLDIRTKCNADIKTSPTPSQESLVSQQSSHSSEDMGTLDPNDDGWAPFMPKPFCVYSGHTADVLDLSWSKNYFMLTSSMDKTVRLWHISRKECLCIFKHVDFVTAIAFHPKDDRYFISGSLDGKLRLWSIPDKQVVMWNEVEGHPKLITAANFCQNGAFTVVGTYNGRCIFYKTEELKYYTQIHVKSSRGKNARGGRKITGIEPLPDENKLMITSNDSRIRLYNLGVLNVCCKYKGCSNMSSQIKAGFSHDGKYIVCGSENQCIYIWKTNYDYSNFSSARKDRNVYWEGVKAHSAVVTCAIFSPRPEHVFNFIEQQKKDEKTSNKGSLGSNKDSTSTNKGYVLVSADFNGCIKIFWKEEKPKHSSLPATAMA